MRDKGNSLSQRAVEVNSPFKDTKIEVTKIMQTPERKLNRNTKDIPDTTVFN